MKSSNWFVRFLSLVALFVFGLGTFGATSTTLSNNTLPIGSEDQLREYALGKVVRGSRSVYGRSVTQVDNKPTWVNVKGNNAEEVLSKLFDTEITFGIGNTNDFVEGNVALFDSSDNLIFSGYTQYKVSDLVSGPPQYNIWMREVRLLEGVAWARILALNPDGVTTRTENVQVANGQVIFEPYMAGISNGILEVSFKGGSLSYFNLWEDKAHDPVVGSEFFPEWKIQSHYVVPGNDSVIITVKFVETMFQPTVFLKEVKAGQVVVFDCLALIYPDGMPAFERPTSVIITKDDGSMSSAPISNDSLTSLKLAPGSYRLRFTWPTFREGRMIGYQSNNDGGLG
jgi:hypothetical protein